ncbi:MAG TPA: AI-2E family transporter [Syntrophomonadaceae bacterium]|nr:AI-2E family transporter [Syntrophomonadaceae bacterium]
MIIKRKSLRYLLLLVLLAGTAYFLYQVWDVVASFLIAALLAYFLYRPVNWVEQKGISRFWSILTVYLLLAAVLALFLWFAIPGLVRELSAVGKMLPGYADQAQDFAYQIENIELPGRMAEILQENTRKIENIMYNGIKGLLGGIYAFFSKALVIIFAPILAFYILKDWEKIRESFFALISPQMRLEASRLFKQIDEVLIEFFKGHLFVATLVGTFTGIAAALLGVKFALLIGILSGVTNLVPYFGPILGGIPAVGLALSQSVRLAIYMTIAIILIQQIESSLITPKIIGDRLGMHPLLIVFALLCGGKLFGIWGMLFSVPVTASLKIIASFAYLKLLDG